MLNNENKKTPLVPFPFLETDELSLLEQICINKQCKSFQNSEAASGRLNFAFLKVSGSDTHPQKDKTRHKAHKACLILLSLFISLHFCSLKSSCCPPFLGDERKCQTHTGNSRCNYSKVSCLGPEQPSLFLEKATVDCVYMISNSTFSFLNHKCVLIVSQQSKRCASNILLS